MQNESRQALMCVPRFFSVSYAINPWMKRAMKKSGNHVVNCDEAGWQWLGFSRALRKDGVTISLIPAVRGSPDMVFTANAGFVYDGKIVLSRFKHTERRPEEDIFEAYFKKETSLQVLRLPQSSTRIYNEGEDQEHHDSSLYFEGHGDMLFFQGIVFAGYGKRSNQSGIVEAIRLSGFPGQCIFLELVDDNFYHLDTCFCPVGKSVVYYPGAFSPESQRSIKREVKRKGGELIPVSEADAMNFVCNSIPLEREGGWRLIGCSPSAELMERLGRLGIDAVPVELGEFHKSGGGARCLVLFI